MRGKKRLTTKELRTRHHKRFHAVSHRTHPSSIIYLFREYYNCSTLMAFFSAQEASWPGTLSSSAHWPVNHDEILLQSPQRAQKPSEAMTKCENSYFEFGFVCCRVCFHGSHVWVCGDHTRGTAGQTSAWLTSNPR